MNLKYSFLVLLIGCGEKAVTINNTAPEVTITSHEDGDVAFTDVAIEFRASVSDANDDFLDLEVQWKVGDRVACPFLAPDSSGLSTCTTTLSTGEEKVYVEVRDPQNATTTTSVELDLQVSLPPTASIQSPFADGIYYSDVLIAFEGQVSDPEDQNEDLDVVWTSTLEGDINVDTSIDSFGMITDFAYLGAGEHGIKLTVTDSSGKVSTDSVTITVKDSNTEPTCQITAPDNESVGQLGQSVVFQGTVNDDDISANFLTVEWSSNQDGLLGTAQASSSGEVFFPYSDLTVGTHVISMTATDEVNASCVSNILYTVGSPPSITVSSPTNGDRVNVGENISFVAEVSDTEDVAGLLSLEWQSSIDGIFNTGTPSSNGVAQFLYNSLSSGNHNITATVTDSTGLTANSIFSIVVNGPPTQPTVSVLPSSPTTVDDVQATASGSTDAEGDVITYNYEWSLVGGAVQHTTNILPASLTNRGETWEVQVTPNDGSLDGDFGETTFVVINSAPVLSSLALSPSTPATQDDVQCIAVASDADNDGLTYNYTWTINGNTQSSTSDTLSGPFQMGDEITCEVYVSDGNTQSVTLSESVIITNTAPTISTAQYDDTSYQTNDVITASGSGSDGDGDNLSYNWEWFVDSGNGPQSVQTGSGQSDSLDGLTHFDKGDVVYAEITVTDGSSPVKQTLPSLTIQNTLPSVYNIVITPSNPVVGQDDITCEALASDADGDQIQLDYAWELDGQMTPFVSQSISVQELAMGQVWNCTVTPNDGDVGQFLSTSIEIGGDNEGATGVAFCNGAGVISDPSGFSMLNCLSESGVVGTESQDDASYVWQPGSIYVFSPE